MPESGDRRFIQCPGCRFAVVSDEDHLNFQDFLNDGPRDVFGLMVWRCGACGGFSCVSCAPFLRRQTDGKIFYGGELNRSRVVAEAVAAKKLSAAQLKRVCPHCSCVHRSEDLRGYLLPHSALG